MSLRLLSMVFLIAGIGAFSAFSRADDAAPTTAPASAPTPITPGDKAAITAAMNSDVIVEGTISTASWNGRGSLMSARFADDNGTKLQIVAFAAKRTDLDKAFNNDLAATLKGAKIRLHGQLKLYTPRTGGEGRPEIILDSPDQLTILVPGPTSLPATAPATAP